MVVEINGLLIGMFVDGVSEVMQISSDIVEAPTGLLLADADENFIEGIANSYHQLVFILNLNTIVVGNDIDLAVCC